MRIFRNKYFVAFGYLVLIKPGCIAGMPALSLVDEIINLLRIILLLYVILGFLRQAKLKVNRLLAVTMLLLTATMWEIVSTYINKMPVTDFGAVMNTAGIILFTYVTLSADYNVYIETVAKTIGSYILINCLTVLLFPNGMYQTSEYNQNFFLSYRTAWFTVYLLGLTAVLLWHSHANTKTSEKWLFAVVGAAYLSMLLQWTATGLFCFTLGGLLLLYWSFRKRDRIISIGKVMLVETVLFYMVVVAQMVDKFYFIIVTLLQKDITLTFRTRIWQNAFAVISDHKMFGVGRLAADDMRRFLGYGVAHPHCRYLYLLMCFGFIGLGLFLLAIYVAARGKVYGEQTQDKHIIITALTVMLTACQVESLAATGAYVYPIIMMAAAIFQQGAKTEQRDVLPKANGRGEMRVRSVYDGRW